MMTYTKYVVCAAAVTFPIVLGAWNPARAQSGAPAEIREKAYLYEVVRHLYRWYMDESDAIQGTTQTNAWEFWVRGLDLDLDPDDNSQVAEIVLPILDIRVRVKKADYTIEEMNAVVKNEMFKITNVARMPTPNSAPPGYTRIPIDYADMRDYLFQTRNETTFPGDELLLRLRLAARKELLKDLKGREEALPEGEQIIHVSPLSPIANELWVFWETGRVLLRFSSDIDLVNPVVWDHEEMAVKMWDIDDQVVVSLEEVAGSNAYLTRDQVGRALFNCIVLGRRMALEPMDLEDGPSAPATP